MSVDFSWKRPGGKHRVNFKSLWKSVTSNLCFMPILHHFCSWRNLPWKFLSSVSLSSLPSFLKQRYFRHLNNDYTDVWEVSKAHEFWKHKSFFFLFLFLQVFVLIIFRLFLLFHSRRQDALTVACNRKHRWRWFIKITHVSDRE